MSEPESTRPAPRSQERGVLAIIRSLQAGECKPASLDKREKRLVVEHMVADEYTVAEIADVLKVTDRTIYRMKQRIREANALRQDPALTGQLAGLLLSHAESAIARLRRLQRECKDETGARLEAEGLAWSVRRELVHMLQSLGYITMAPRPGGGPDQARVPSAEELEAEFREIQALVALPPPPPPAERTEPPEPARAPAQPTPSSEIDIATLRDPDAIQDSSVTIEFGTDGQPVRPFDIHPLTGDKTPRRRRFDPPVCEPVPEAPPPPASGELSS